MISIVLLTPLLLGVGDVTIPILNRPANFSGAAGVYRMEVEASPTTVRVEDPITLTVKIVSLTPPPWPHPPQRDKLKLLPANLAEHFFIEPVPEEDEVSRKDQSWTFVWRLMPKHAGNQQLPPLEFVYYHLSGSPDFKAIASQSIDLQVQPKTPLELVAPAGTLTQFGKISTNPNLASLNSVAIYWPWALALPPLICLGGYAIWRRLFPEAAERLRRHRSQARRVALGKLQHLEPSASPHVIREIVADYLRCHLPLPRGGATARELKQTLQERNIQPNLVAQAAELFERCDAASFAPNATANLKELRAAAQHLIPMLEAHLCSPSAWRQVSNLPNLPASWKYVALIGLLICPAVTSAFQDPPLPQAARLFRQGKESLEDRPRARSLFHAAALEYQKLVDAGCDHPELFLNLGNAHMLADELPEAILAYRRGLRHDPLHAQLWANLRAARDLVAYPQSAAPQRPAGDDWPPWLPRPSPAWLSNAALFLYSAAWGAVALWLVLRRRYWLLAACSIFLTAALLAGFLGFLEHRSADDATLPLAVVRLNGLTLRQGNGSLYPRHTELPIVQRGMEARLLSRRGGWVQLQFPAGEVGWLPSSAVCVDE